MKTKIIFSFPNPNTHSAKYSTFNCCCCFFFTGATVST